MEIKLNNNDRKIIKFIAGVIFFGFWFLVLGFFGRSKPGLYEITLKEIHINENDFNLDSFGDPLPISLYVYKDGKEIFNKDIGRLRGTNKYEHIYFKLMRSSKSVYEVKLVERAIISKFITWTYPKESKEGDWYFDQAVLFKENGKQRTHILFESKYLE